MALPDADPQETASIPSTETADLRRQPVGGLKWIDSFAAFRHRNYRIFFFGQIISLVGTWLQTTAEGWLVYDLSASPTALGFIRFAHMLPFALFALWGGIVADRFAKRSILLYTQSASMLLALALAALVHFGVIHVWHVAVLACLLGSANAFDVPARQSFIVDLVGRDDLMNGIALNSSMFSLTRVVGPAIAGLLIGAIGMAGCFLLNGVSYLAVISGYLLLRLPPFVPRPNPAPFGHAIREAYSHVISNGPLRTVMLLVTTFSLFGISYSVLMPIFAKDVLHGNAQAFGILMAANGLGALCGGLFLASAGKHFKRRNLLYVGLFGCCLFVGGFALSRQFWLSCGLLLCAGFFMIVFLATANTSVQLRSPDHLRGRIMGFYSLSFLGMSSVGSLLAGTLASWITAPWAVLLGVVLCSGVALLTFGKIIPVPSELEPPAG